MDEPNEHILALSWKIATEPKIYRDLIPNPYAPRAIQIISERFPGTSAVDVIRAVVLAEPEGIYDWNFRELPKVQQEEELIQQKRVSAEINERLAQYGKKYTPEFSRLPKEFIYACLSVAAFETADLKEIEQKYAQHQRRDSRLSIINFIEDVQKNTSNSLQRDANKAAPDVASGKNLVPGRLLKIGLAVLSLVSFMYLASGFYENQGIQKQIQFAPQHQDAKKQVSISKTCFFAS